MKKRKPWLAFWMSMLCPGLGQLYNGSWRIALVAMVLGISVATYTSIYLFGTFSLLLQALALSLILDLVFAVHAYMQAKRLGAIVLQPYQRWWIYVGFAVVLYGLPDGYGTIIPQRFKSFQIPSESMLPNLLVGDRLVADGWAYWKNDPQRGDVAVFDYPKDPSVKYVKRVIGVPGDVVELRQGELYLNGSLVPQARTARAIVPDGPWSFVEFRETLNGVNYLIQRAQPEAMMNFGPVTVPEGNYFVMGDNRDRSSDSRAWGFVKRDEMIGRMSFIYFSWDSEAGSLRNERMGLQIE